MAEIPEPDAQSPKLGRRATELDKKRLKRCFDRLSVLFIEADVETGDSDDIRIAIARLPEPARSEAEQLVRDNLPQLFYELP